MAKRKSQRQQPQQEPDVHKDLKGLDIEINEFGQISSSIPIERINEFLNNKLRENTGQSGPIDPKGKNKRK
jgi:hypothetical protein